MDSNRLKMNNGKTEFILLGSRSQLTKCTTEVVDVNWDRGTKEQEYLLSGGMVRPMLSLKRHITKKCTTVMLSFQRIKLIRRCLTKHAATTLILGLVISHLDYSNLILYGLTDCGINKFQRIQNMSAKLVLQCKKVTVPLNA